MPGRRAWSLPGLFPKALDAAQIGDQLSQIVIKLPASLITLGVITIVFLQLAACVTLSEEERAEKEYMRANNLILAREQYHRRLVMCRANGGIMQITKFSNSKLGNFTAREYKMARCAKY